MHVNTVHLKRKPFECGYCNQVFGRKDAAKRHEKQWCSNRPVKMEIQQYRAMKIENTPMISRDIFKIFVDFFKKETTEIMDTE